MGVPSTWNLREFSHWGVWAVEAFELQSVCVCWHSDWLHECIQHALAVCNAKRPPPCCTNENKPSHCSSVSVPRSGFS